MCHLRIIELRLFCFMSSTNKRKLCSGQHASCSRVFLTSYQTTSIQPLARPSPIWSHKILKFKSWSCFFLFQSIQWILLNFIVVCYSQTVWNWFLTLLSDPTRSYKIIIAVSVVFHHFLCSASLPGQPGCPLMMIYILL